MSRFSYDSVLIFPILGSAVALASFPIFETTGFLLGICVLAPIFIVSLKETIKPEFKGWPLLGAIAYWFATICLLIQLLLFTTGTSQELDFFEYPWFVAGFAWFVLASVALMWPIISSATEYQTSRSVRFPKLAFAFFLVALYATRAKLVYFDLVQQAIGLHFIALSFGFACALVMGYGFISNKIPRRWMILLGVVSFAIVLASYYLYPS